MADFILEQTAEEVQRAINKSLESGVYIGSGDMPEGYDIQIDPSGDNSVVDGAIITVPVDGWISNDGGTYTNTIVVDGVTSTTTYDVSLYGDITEEQATAYSESITSVMTNEGQIVITASESINVELQLLLRGRINFSEQSVVYLKDPKAINMSYDNSSSKLTATNVQSAVDEVAGNVNELYSKIAYSRTTVTSDYCDIIYAEKQCGRVQVYIEALKNIPIGTSTTIFVLPENYRPKLSGLRFDIVNPNNTVIRFSVYSNGGVDVYAYGENIGNTRAVLSFFG